MLNRMLNRLAWMAVGLIGGAGVVVIGDPGIDAPSTDAARPRWLWVEPMVVLVLALGLAFALGAPPAGIAVGAVIGLLIVVAALVGRRR